MDECIGKQKNNTLAAALNKLPVRLYPCARDVAYSNTMSIVVRMMKNTTIYDLSFG